MAVASLVGCSFRLDLGYFQARNQRLDVTKAREVPRWRESQVLEALGPAERAVFVLREVFGTPYGEIAAVVEKSPAAVRQIARRAREHLAAGRPRAQAPGVRGDRCLVQRDARRPDPGW
jgi:DNA-directed RNA polymerase specialized sigma24 family protein